ncbi:MAG: glycosyl transferase [Deltaproteobacteria bacterium HGW-Deltaproteobacteria-13]|nr:MAG: glycosyl transferase [Deltaproteobacteria bacterium HGW-Deltaproteobacteria-13]
MTILEISFWILMGIILYTYLGYGALVVILGWVKGFFRGKQRVIHRNDEPSVTLLVSAFNEEAWLKKKIENSISLDYPEDKLKIIVITDGSNDGSAKIAKINPRIIHLHEVQRRGKTAAINRAMKFVDTDIVIFSDANTLLNREAVRELVLFFRDPAVGCVSGEKRVYMGNRNGAASAGEGTYWRFESLIKKWEARLGSCVSAAGELFAIRSDLFMKVPEDTLIEDFVISLRIALGGYRIQYAPGAYAMETSSSDIGEEFKRKIRIAGGHLQSILRMPGLLNPFRHGMLTFQYVSHKFLRSFIAPFCLIALIPVNLFLLPKSGVLYVALFMLQVIFYLVATAGYLLQKRHLASRLFFVPLYITIMNVSALTGFFRYLRGQQSVLWEKSARMVEPEPEDVR